MKAELQSTRKRNVQFHGKTINGRKQFKTPTPGKRSGPGPFYAARGIIRRELEQVAHKNPRNATIADVDRLINNRKKSSRRKALDRGKRVRNVLQPIYEFTTLGVVWLVASYVNGLLGA